MTDSFCFELIHQNYNFNIILLPFPPASPFLYFSTPVKLCLLPPMGVLPSFCLSLCNLHSSPARDIYFRNGSRNFQCVSCEFSEIESVFILKQLFIFLLLLPALLKLYKETIRYNLFRIQED